MLRMMNHRKLRNRISSQAFAQFGLATICRTSSTTSLEDPNFFIRIMDYGLWTCFSGLVPEKQVHVRGHGTTFIKNNVANSLLTDLGDLGEQSQRSGESTRFPPLWPGFDFLTRRHIWIEFVGFLL